MDLDQVAELFLIFFFGIVSGLAGFWLFQRFKLGGYEKIAKAILEKAELDASNTRQSGEMAVKQFQLEQQREMEQAWQSEKRKIMREDERQRAREDKLENRMMLVDKKLSDLEKREADLATEKVEMEVAKKQVCDKQATLIKELEQISGLSSQEARDLLINRMTNEVRTDAANLMRRMRKEAEEQADTEAAKIIATAINRLAVSCASESTVNSVAIPNDDMKGRIIGREGRNIRALEHATGVNFIIDDTPGAVVLSGFDPVRMHVAKTALTELLCDGRIFPTRIEEVVEKAQLNVKKQIKQYGEDAALRAGIMNFHPEIITLLGKLKFRFSYGQNILEHSLEVCHIMGMMAAELGLDVRMAKRIGLLHDMGKAVSHEMEGSHAIIGHELALKYGESKEVANGIGCHHYEMAAMTIEGSFCSAADAISASRPGARIEAVEEYVKRLGKLEEMACAFPGVEKAYAMQAGREVRIVVQPNVVDDEGVTNIARALAKKIEEELSYPGRIKVVAIREKRVVEYAA